MRPHMAEPKHPHPWLFALTGMPYGVVGAFSGNVMPYLTRRANLDVGEIKQAGGDTCRREVKLKTSLDSDTAKKVAAAIKDAKLKKVQASIQGDQVRVSSPSKDDLQDAIALLRKGDYGVELKFGNFR